MLYGRSDRPVITALVLCVLWLSACAGVAPPRPVAAAASEGAPAMESSSGAAEQYDVIVVGAGLAGLTTARSLVADGHRVLIVEATNRIGGRALTDSTSFSIPIDLGAAWIHGFGKYPLTGMADLLGFKRVPTDLDGPVVVTVSTGVLAARRISFEPALPESKWAAIKGLPMGLLNKIVFEFSGDILPDETSSEWVLYQDPAGKAPPFGAPVMAFVVKPLGANVIVGFYGAEQARYYENAIRGLSFHLFASPVRLRAGSTRHRT